MLNLLILIVLVSGDLLTVEDLHQQDYGEYLLKTISLQLSSGPSDKALELLLGMKEKIQNESSDSLRIHAEYQGKCDKSLQEYDSYMKSTKLQHTQSRNNLEQWQKKQKDWRSQLTSAQRDLATYNEIHQQVIEKREVESEEYLGKTEDQKQIMMEFSRSGGVSRSELSEKDLNTLKTASNVVYSLMQLLDHEQSLDVNGFLEASRNTEGKIQRDYQNSLSEYIEEIEREIGELEFEIADLEASVNHWDAKVTECRAQYEESERRLEQIPKLISEKQGICNNESKQFEAKSKRDENQIIMIDSVVYLVQNNLFENQS